MEAKQDEALKKEFVEADKKLDKVMENNRSNIQIKRKIFMKISDVDVDDAAWFKTFCDRHTDGKQFLGIKVIRTVMERMEPFLNNVLVRMDQVEARISSVESMLQSNPEEDPKLVIPKTQGSAKERRAEKEAKVQP